MLASFSFAGANGKGILFSRSQRSPKCNSLRPSMLAARDVVVIGGGVIGLSTAFELARTGKRVQVIVRDVTESSSKAGAGMLAPVSEGLHEHVDMQRLCSISRNMYPKFVDDLQSLSGMNIQYVSHQDYLMPLLHDESTYDVPGGTFLDTNMLRTVEPTLGPAVRGAIRVPGDAHVNNRALVEALLMACRNLNVQISEGAVVQKLQVAADGSAVEGLVLESGDFVTAEHYVAACGAWSSRLLKGIPVRPVKGQMLCLKPLDTGNNSSPTLQHVLFGRDVYIVPKDNCSKYYVGATVEEAGYCRSTTAGGVLQLLNAATTLVPNLAEYYISETWAGLRPGTPDKNPIIGYSDFENLTLATGTYRNGILLAPAVGKLSAACVLDEVESLSAELQLLLKQFSLSRFLDPSSLRSREDLTKEPVVRVKPNAANVKNANADKIRTQGVERQNGAVGTPESGSGAMVWVILPDGTREPVQPSARFLKMKRLASRNTASNGISNETDKRLDPEKIGASISPSPLPTPEVPPPSADVGTSNDAYDDVMQYRDNAEQVMSEGMARSRAYGRTKSSLENDDEVLSLSAEEERQFDAAFNAAKEEIATWDDTMLTQNEYSVAPDDPVLLQSEFPPATTRQQVTL